jgi:hypothetical protein
VKNIGASDRLGPTPRSINVLNLKRGKNSADRLVNSAEIALNSGIDSAVPQQGNLLSESNRIRSLETGDELPKSSVARIFR